ncbi:glycosyltransferase, partial [Agromyces seonyuensis]
LPAALAVARERVPGLRAVVTGRGPESAAAERAAVDAGVTESVDFVGRVSDEELERLLGEAAVLVNPSRREGFGLVVAEAAAFGTPSVVVAGVDNAAAELVEDGVNGFVAADVSAGSLGAAIVAALEGGEALRADTAEWYARERVERSLDRSVGELLERLGFGDS